MFLHGLVIVISILTSFPQVWSQNCVLVDGKFNLTFNYNTSESAVFWRRNGAPFFTAAVDTSSGSGCPGGNTKEGFNFYCEDGGATYIMEITSALRDKDVNFTTNPIVGSLVYTPILDLDQCPNKLYDCNQPGEKIDVFTLSCESSCTQNHYIILQYQLESGTVENLENPVKATILKCHQDADLYNSTFSYVIDSNHTVVNQFNSPTKRIKLIVMMVIEGTPKEVFETNYFYIDSTGTMTTPTTSQTSPSSSSDSSTQASPFSYPTSSPSQPSFSSSQPGQDTGDSSSTNPASTDTTPALTNPVSTDPFPGTLTSTETIIIIVCCCIGVVILVVLVVCCVVVYMRRRGRSRKQDSRKYNNNSVPRSDLHTGYPVKYNNNSVPRSYLHTRYPYHHSPSGEVPRYTNRGYKPWNTYEDGYRYSKPTDRHTQYNNVYNHPRPYRYQREELYMKPDRMYHQPYQYYYY